MARLDRGALSRLRTVASDGRRLVADQAFQAIHTAGLQALKAEGVDLVDWVLSPAHREYDVCDELAAGSPYKLANVPKRPHPWCGCMPRRRGQKGPMRITQTGMAAGREALALYETTVDFIAHRMALSGGMPTTQEVAEAAEDILRTAVEAVRAVMRQVGGTPSVPLTQTALSHLPGVRRDTNHLLAAAEDLEVPARQVRADLAALLRGDDIDYTRYNVPR